MPVRIDSPAVCRAKRRKSIAQKTNMMGVVVQERQCRRDAQAAPIAPVQGHHPTGHGPCLQDTMYIGCLNAYPSQCDCFGCESLPVLSKGSGKAAGKALQV
jgi:hypothetical protein